MIRSYCSDLNKIKKTRDVINDAGDIKTFQEFLDWWFSGNLRKDYKVSILLLIGMYDLFNTNSDDAAVRLIYLPDYTVGKEKCMEAAKPFMKKLHLVHGAILDSKSYRDVDIIFSRVMSLRLYKYMTRLGFKTPEELLMLYRVGALGDELKSDAERALSNEIVDLVIPEDTEVEFAEDINNLPNVIPKEKYKYIRIARSVRVPNEVLKVIGRPAILTYDGNKEELVYKLFDKNNYTDQEKDFLLSYVAEGRDAINRTDLPSQRINELLGAMRMMM